MQQLWVGGFVHFGLSQRAKARLQRTLSGTKIAAVFSDRKGGTIYPTRHRPKNS